MRRRSPTVALVASVLGWLTMTSPTVSSSATLRAITRDAQSSETQSSEAFRALRQLAVAVRDPAGGVGPPAQRHPVVRDRDVGMVVRLLRHLGHPVHEVHRGPEVGEAELALEGAVHLAPAFGHGHR